MDEANHAKELAELAIKYKDAYSLLELAMGDGINVHGALAGMSGAKDMLVAKAVEIHDSEQVREADAPLEFLLNADNCMCLINGEPIKSNNKDGDNLVLFTDDDNYVVFSVNERVKLPVPPEGQAMTNLDTGETEMVSFNLMRTLHPRDFRDGKVITHD